MRKKKTERVIREEFGVQIDEEENPYKIHRNVKGMQKKSISCQRLYNNQLALELIKQSQKSKQDSM